MSRVRRSPVGLLVLLTGLSLVTDPLSLCAQSTSMPGSSVDRRADGRWVDSLVRHGNLIRKIDQWEQASESPTGGSRPRVDAADSHFHVRPVVYLAPQDDDEPSPGQNVHLSDDPQAPWPESEQLIAQLDEMARFPLTRNWARTTIQLLSQVGSATGGVGPRLASIEKLASHTESLRKLNQQIVVSEMTRGEAIEVASQISRMHYRLTRRIDIWRLTAQLPVEATLSDAASPFQQTSAGRINYGELDPHWAEYLLLEEFQSTFNSLKSDSEQKKETARRILGRMHSPILSASQSKYAQEVFDPSVVEFLKQHASDPVDRKDLLTQIEFYESKPSSVAGHYLNDRYQDLLWSDDTTDQALATTLNAHYRNANFRLAISRDFMNRLLPQLPTIAEPVSETVQGARVSGQSRVSNQIEVELVPDPNQLNLRIRTDGQVESDTVARTKGFKILNQGHASFEVYKQILVNRDGIDASRRAYSRSSANQFLVGVQSKLDNVPVFGYVARRMAEKKVMEQSPETDQLFRRKVAVAAETRVEEELARQITQVRQSANEKLLQPLIAMELEPEPLQLATTADEIVIRYRLAGRDQMAANTSRPKDAEASLVSFQIHQSLVNNSIARLGLNEQTFNSQQLAAHLQDVLGLPEKQGTDELDQEARDAEFTFAKYDPIRIDFVDDRINVVLNLASLKIGENGTRWRNLSLLASYAITSNGMQVALQQDDDGTRIQGRRLRLSDRAAISTVMKVLFKQNYEFNALPAQFRQHAEAGSLAISQLAISDGWIGVSLSDRQAMLTRANELPESLQRFGTLRKMLDHRQQ